MHFNSKGALSLGLIAAAALSQAALNYNNVSAKVTFDGVNTIDMNVLIDGNSITFTSIPPMIVSTFGPPSTAVIDISYDVTSQKGINGLDLIFTGMAFGNGNVGYNETVKDDADNVIASISGNKSNEAFSVDDFLSFSNGAETSYHVTKSFTLDLNGGNTLVHQLGVSQEPSGASIGLIEQNAVPEPASMGALAVGALGLLARRRRK